MSDRFTRRDFLGGMTCATAAFPIWSRLGWPTLAHGAADHDGGTKIPVQAFPLRHVRLHAGPWRSALETNRTFMLQLDLNGLLHMFRVTAGLPSTAKPYGGWEAPNN